MKLLRRIVRWPLLPILMAGLLNVLVWYRLLLPTGFIVLAFGSAAVLATITGMTTPRLFHRFAVLCLMIPAFMFPTPLGPLLVFLLFPFAWFGFVAVLVPVYFGYAFFVWLGQGIREAGKSRIHPDRSDSSAGSRTKALQQVNGTAAKIKRKLSIFDWIGVIFVALIGACAGWEISTASDIDLTPGIVVMFPGYIIGAIACETFSRKAGQITIPLANGIIHGLLMYGWDRFANGFHHRPPK